MRLPVAYQNQFNSVHVRAYQLPDYLPCESENTSEIEILSVITSTSMHHQKSWSFLLTRTVLGEVLQKDPQAIEIDRIGKPFLVNKSLHFNVSHSENLWVIAWSFEREVGVDVQKIDPSIYYEAIARQFFTVPEQLKVKTAFDFFDLWTQKEAALKLKGQGVAYMPKISMEDVQLVPLDIDPAFKACLAL